MNIKRKSLEFQEGFHAYGEGKNYKDNPYKWSYEKTKGATKNDLETLSGNYSEWARGYNHAEDTDETE